MEIAVVITFIIGYLAITLEHPLKMDKTVPAIIMAAICWALIALGQLDVFEIHNGLVSLTEKVLQNPIFIEEQKELGSTAAEMKSHAHAEAIVEALSHHLYKTAEILFFLMGAMTIVEIVDLHRGFSVIKSFIKTRSKKKLLWIICILAFILSAIIDNLTATIVLITILRKLVKNSDERIWFVGMIVISANAGGAWSPIGDVTTTMLWIANNVTVIKLIEFVFIPSVLCMVVPTFIVSYNKAFKGDIEFDEGVEESYKSSKFMLFLGLGMILMVPIFKVATHLPPYIGMLLALGVVWAAAEYAKPVENYDSEAKMKFSVHRALSKIEMSSILFFLGILLAVGALESLGHLFHFADMLQSNLSNEITVILLGIGSAIIDNVPLVAASIGMFHEPTDAELWHFIAFSTGTGGSMLIIGSAAGVAAMGMERINFFWYLKKMSYLAFIGFIVGCGTFILFQKLGLYS